MPTHEYLSGCNIKQILRGIKVYQDRTNDDKLAAWTKDKELLEKEYEADQSDQRIVFYLAQTYSCLGENEKSIEMYKKRISMGGFIEELFEANMRIASMLDTDEVLLYYHRAYNLLERAEPLVKISQYYRLRSKMSMAYIFAKLACSLPYPENCCLFVDRSCYDYSRWLELSISSYYVGDMENGKKACELCMTYGIDPDLHKANLTFYA
jgi:tetratricopeptide (TPR) repeat protein